jgi:hypothetical protein
LGLVFLAASGGAGRLGRRAAESLAFLGGYGHELAQQHRDGKVIINSYFDQLAVEQAGDDTFFGTREQADAVSNIHNLKRQISGAYAAGR